MLKDIDFSISYDIDSCQDISQKLMPKIRLETMLISII